MTSSSGGRHREEEEEREAAQIEWVWQERISAAHYCRAVRLARRLVKRPDHRVTLNSSARISRRSQSLHLSYQTKPAHRLMLWVLLPTFYCLGCQDRELLSRIVVPAQTSAP